MQKTVKLSIIATLLFLFTSVTLTSCSMDDGQPVEVAYSEVNGSYGGDGVKAENNQKEENCVCTESHQAKESMSENALAEISTTPLHMHLVERPLLPGLSWAEMNEERDNSKNRADYRSLFE